MLNNSGPLKLTLLLVSSLTIMSIVTISPSLPEMSAHFSGIDHSDFLVKMVLTLPALFIAIGAPVAGILIDKYGRLKLLWIALTTYALSGISGFFLDDIYYLLISRALLGMSVGVSMTIVITLIADYFDGSERQKFVGTQVAFMSFGGIIFIGLGGILADVSWRHPFLLYLLSLVILPLTILYLYEPEIQKHKTTGTPQLKPPGIIWLLFVNVLFMWVFFFMIPVQIPFQLKSLGVEKNSLIGAAIALSTAFSVISSISFSKIKNKLSHLIIFSIGYLLMAISFGLVAFADSYFIVLIAMMFGGLGMGMMIPNTNMWVMNITPPAIRGKEIGKLTTFWFLGQFLSPILLLPVSARYSFSITFYIAAACLFTLSIMYTILYFTKLEKPT
ncbi:MAG: MFS transporter [Bacteroidota bacterium]